MSLGLVIVLFLVLCSVFINGWTDAPNAIATVVSTRVLSPRAAVLLAIVFNLLGVLIMGTAVAVTMQNLVNFGSNKEALVALAAAQLSIVIWSVSAWKFGIPTSESHALIAGLMGAGMSYLGFDAFDPSKVMLVVYGLVISTIFGFVSGLLATKVVSFGFKNVKRSSANRFFSVGQICSASLMAFTHGGQDGQKFMGVFALALYYGGLNDNKSIALWVMILCSLIMGIGTSIGGYKIIKTMGLDMVKLEKYQGFSAEIAASGLMLVATGFGIPLSTTNTKGTAMMGSAAARRLSNVNWNIVKEMLLAWALTFPACLVMGYLMAKFFSLIF